jgi:autotransporter-associated beta strand protein
MWPSSPKQTAGRFASVLAIVTACFCFHSSARAGSQQLYLQCLTNFEVYAESIWHTASYGGAPADSGYWGDGGSTGNGGIRGNGGVALAYAVLVIAQPADPKTATRLSRIRQALNYSAATHVTGGNNTVAGNQWGWSGVSTDWQTPEWSASLGLACILVQSNLPAATIDGIRRVVADEADHRAGIPPASGYIGDTKAEENGWQGNILALAAAWMSTSNNAPTWLDAAKSYLVNTYTVASTNGDPLASWVTTQTLFPSYAIENHNFYHPTYEMVAGMSSGDSLVMARLANTNVATQLEVYAEHNVLTVWKTNLAYLLLDSGEFGYPSGLDWELHDYEQNSYITWMAAHFNDPLARWADDRLAQLVRYRQIVNTDGTHDGMFVGPSVNKGSGDPFFREAVEARRTAIAWLHWATADFPTGPTNAPPPATIHFPDVGVIAQRSPWSYVTVSYKNAVMGMVEAAAASIPTNPFVATPAVPGGFGHGSLGNPTSATLVSLTTNSVGFTAQLLVQNGGNGSTRVYVLSSGESIGVVEIPLPASGVTGSAAGCFTNGIENDPLTGGTRLVEWTGNSATFTNRTGITRNITNGWVCVSGNYGLASGPGGFFRYRTATSYNRAGAAQDYLHVIPQSRLGARYAVWFPGKNAAQTAALAGQITWVTNGSTVVLTFPGPGGATNSISGSLISGNGTWSADADGNWSDPSKWTSGAIADGVANIADFSTLDLAASRTVTLDSARTIGTLRFGDTSGGQNWTLNSSGGSALTLAAGTPAIVVNQNLATLNVPLAGTSGFAKSGSGTLVLSGNNSLSGTVFLDSNSTSANDGAVRITSSAALANVSALSIRNNTGPVAASTLQLDGSSGNITVTPPLTASCRANIIPTIQNLAGSNTFTGDVFMQVGGSNVVFQSDSGTLVLAGALQYIGSFTSARTWNFFGDGNTLVSGPILFSSIAPLSLGKYGNGTLLLNGNNTYLGGTTVYDGTLGGNGTIAGPVTVLAGAVLSPGTSIGKLTINNTLNSAGTLLMELNKTGSVLTNDAIVGLGTITYGGTLQLVPTGGALAMGDSFKLFDAANYLGSFNAITPDTPGAGLAWNTSGLTVNGTLSVAIGNAKPQVNQVSLIGTNVVWSGTGGAAASAYTILTSTNIAAPLTNWGFAGTGVFDTNGNFIATNGFTAGFPQRYYVIRIP